MTPTLQMNADGTITLPDGTVFQVAGLPQPKPVKAVDPKRADAAKRAWETMRAKAAGTYVAPAKPEPATGSEADKRRAAALKAWDTMRSRAQAGLGTLTSERGAITSVDSQLAVLRVKATSWFGTAAIDAVAIAGMVQDESQDAGTVETPSAVPETVLESPTVSETSDTPTLDAILNFA
jgi:hypothetical protein